MHEDRRNVEREVDRTAVSDDGLVQESSYRLEHAGANVCVGSANPTGDLSVAEDDDYPYFDPDERAETFMHLKARRDLEALNRWPRGANNALSELIAEQVPDRECEE